MKKEKPIQPMRAATLESFDDLRVPTLGSFKYDGFRAMVKEGALVSKNLKPIRNKHVQRLFGLKALEGLDGELIYGDPTDPQVFKKTSSAVTSIEGAPDVFFHCFDMWHLPGEIYLRRNDLVRKAVTKNRKLPLVHVEQHVLTTLSAAEAFERRAVELRYEGAMFRCHDGFYKYGRSTLNEGYLLKMKRFVDAEAEIIGFEEEMENTNQATTSLTGAKERSTKKSGMVGKNTLGAIKVRGLNGMFKGVVFTIGSGFGAATSLQIWLNRDVWLGKIVKYKFFPVGSDKAPRFPVFKGVVDESDFID